MAISYLVSEDSMPKFKVVIEKTSKEVQVSEVDGDDSLEVLDRVRARIKTYNDVSSSETVYAVKSVDQIIEELK